MHVLMIEAAVKTTEGRRVSPANWGSGSLNL